MNQLFKQVAWKAQIKMAALFAVGLLLSSCNSYYCTQVVQYPDGRRMVQMKRFGEYIYTSDDAAIMRYGGQYSMKTITHAARQ